MAEPQAKSETAVAEGNSPPASAQEPANLTDLQKRLLDFLRNQPEPLFALLDAARDGRVLDLLRNSGEKHESLYEGKQGEDLASFAPYLAQLPKESRLLATLVQEGWGKSWGVYLTSAAELEEIRRHLRHFLQVKLPSGEQVYFRFYDPRVLRVFLPTCMPEDTTRFFGPIQNYLVEDENPKKLMQFVNTGQGSQKMLIVLGDRDQQRKAPSPNTETQQPQLG